MRGQGTRFPTGSGTGRTALDILTGAGNTDTVQFLRFAFLIKR